MNHLEVCETKLYKKGTWIYISFPAELILLFCYAGMHAWFAAAADTRYAVVVPIIGVQVVCLISLIIILPSVIVINILDNYDCRGFDGP